MEFQSEQGRRCGICGSCGSMPPWAPERVRELTPAQKDALFARMREKQEAFIRERDAKRAVLEENHHDQLIDEINDVGEEDEDDWKAFEGVANNVEEITLDEERSDDRDFLEETQSTEDREVMEEVTLDSPRNSVIQPNPQATSNATTSEVSEATEELISTAQDPSSDQNIQQADLGSSPIRKLSQSPERSMDSDADSFHTADEENDPQSPPNTAHATQQTASVEPANGRLRTMSRHSVLSSSDLEESETPVLTSPPSPPLPTTQIPLTPSVVTPTAPTVSMLDLEKQPSSDLEASVRSRRQHTRSNSQMEEYPLPADLVPIRTCEDCERWRGRVQELQEQVEALTSALAAREMEVAGLKRGRLRLLGKNEARLVQECESLRVTTEFLYRRLEKYEGENAEVH